MVGEIGFLTNVRYANGESFFFYIFYATIIFSVSFIGTPCEYSNHAFKSITFVHQKFQKMIGRGLIFKSRWFLGEGGFCIYALGRKGF